MKRGVDDSPQSEDLGAPKGDSLKGVSFTGISIYPRSISLRKRLGMPYSTLPKRKRLLAYESNQRFSARVMATCAVGGQAVGCAISLCEKYNAAPCEINSHIEELQQLILADDGYVPGLKKELFQYIAIISIKPFSVDNGFIF